MLDMETLFKNRVLFAAVALAWVLTTAAYPQRAAKSGPTMPPDPWEEVR